MGFPIAEDRIALPYHVATLNLRHRSIHIAIDQARTPTAVHSQHCVADARKEALRYDAANESSSRLRHEIEPRPSKNISIVDHDPSGPTPIESDAGLDVIWNRHRHRIGTRRLAADRQHGHTWCRFAAPFNRDDEAGTHLASFDLPRGLFVGPKEMMIDDLADLRGPNHCRSIDREMR